MSPARVGWAVIASLMLALWLVFSATPVLGGGDPAPPMQNITILKQDEALNPIADVTFDLAGSGDIATDGSGSAVFTGVLLGSADLELKETSNPSDSCNDPEDDVLGSLFIDVSITGVVTVDDPDTEDGLTAEVGAGELGPVILVTNTCGEDSDGSGITNDVTIDLNILKQDQDGEPLADVEFGLFTDASGGGFTTGDDGTFALPDITLDAIGEVDLTLTETVNDNEGCEEDVLGSLDIDVISATELEVTDTDTDDALTAEVVDGTIVITNDCAIEVPIGDSDDLVIIKVDQDGARLAGVDFTLAGDGGGGTTDVQVTDGDGIALFENPAFGASFTLTETAGAERCEQAADASIDIDVSLTGVVTATDPDAEDSLDVDLESDLDVLGDADVVVLVNTCGDSGQEGGGGVQVPDTATTGSSGTTAPLAALAGLLVLMALAASLLTAKGAGEGNP